MSKYQGNREYSHMMNGVSREIQDQWQAEQAKAEAEMRGEKPVETKKEKVEKVQESPFQTFTRLSRKTKSQQQNLSENYGLGMVSPTPIMVNQTPTGEPMDRSAHVALTSPDHNDSHTHFAHYDDMGNGQTENDDTGHVHIIRSFMVAPYQYPNGSYYSDHSGKLATPVTNPGAEYKDYTGEM